MTEIMTCQSCHEEIATKTTGLKYCPQCGARLRGDGRPPEADERPTVQAVIDSPTATRKKCPKCGSAVKMQRNFCPSCGSRFLPVDLAEVAHAAEEAEREAAEEAATVRLGRTKYLSGQRPRLIRLTFTPTWVLLDDRQTIEMAHVTSIEVIGSQAAKSKWGATLAFGVYGGLAAKGAADRTCIVVHVDSGDDAYFEIAKRSEAAIRAALSPLLRSLDMPFHDEVVLQEQQDALRSGAASAAPPELSDEIAKLAELHEAGTLTDEEFTAAKARLLASL